MCVENVIIAVAKRFMWQKILRNIFPTAEPNSFAIFWFFFCLEHNGKKLIKKYLKGINGKG